ncbi:Cj0069 family protein [Suttonella sp. R2A3]|uniref:Cj0069 family protein n=1 Tax=Suttonella sp. R2A3 TaxID=2908648 RepID=UPI001F33880A|nr:Cj0069 family protein [Suttonella sp. R2A3]UJF24549.1 Cj0069 family protein [Suttonella sp. R2A3]
MKKSIVIFEAEGGSDKTFNGHRKDTLPILDAIKQKGWGCEIVYFRDQWAGEIFDYCNDRFDGYISRINPGNLEHGEKIYFETLRRLSDAGLVGMSHPDAMINFGAKDALVKLAQTDLVPEDTYAYYTIEDFKKIFPQSISHGERVLKQNRGSTGEGIWRVQISESVDYQPGDSLPLDTKLKCTEAVDNHVEYPTLEEFMIFCEQYIVGDNGMLVDMRFMPRIKEGEIRILLIGEQPIFVVHKKPADAEDAFSATLFSGAKYTYDKPEDWADLMTLFNDSLPIISDKLGGFDIPLIWTADFMLDWDADGNDTYVLGEINCSCVGFTSHLDQGIQEVIADEVISRVEQAHA